MRWVAGVALLLASLVVTPPPAGPSPRMPAPHARIGLLATLDSLRLEGCGAWSPRGTRLALLRGTTQIWLVDGAHRTVPPRMLYDARQWIRSYGWSPDGSWLLLVVGDAHPRDHRMLVAVPLDGSGPDTLRTRETIWWAFWGADGLIHYRVKWGWADVPPPAQWKPGPSFVARQPLAFDMGSGLDLWFRPVDPRQAFDLVCLGDFRHDGIQLRVLDMLPDGSRYLVAISEDTTAALRLVDREGRTLLDLRQAGIRFEPTALSADGLLIVGFSGDWVGEGWPRTRLEAADASGHCSVRIAGGEGGEAPQMSREGSYIAFRTARGTSVARLVIEPR